MPHQSGETGRRVQHTIDDMVSLVLIVCRSPACLPACLPQDFEDMKEVCARLGIEALEVNFVKEYWNSVFLPFVEDFQSNTRTPNPDVSCNAHIKFREFRRHVLHSLRFDCMATGHYVRLESSSSSSSSQDLSCPRAPPRLLRGIDSSKDQSYFLSTTAVRNTNG